jgi:hypothetical protein
MLQNNNYFTNFEKEIVTELKSMKEKLRDIELEKARKEYFLQYPSYLQSPPGYYHNP